MLMVVLAFACALPSTAEAQRADRAKKHFDRARDLDSLNDVRAEQEYQAAIEARGGTLS